MTFEILERHDGMAVVPDFRLSARFRQPGGVAGESDDLVIAIALKVLVCDIGDLSEAENNEWWHRRSTLAGNSFALSSLTR
ncbi:hypothetical protein [Accumulibacter sp.]|uniref:hypothetical protein n=1 Tax=Accumulibacter sp. TaxID=2053492 RepID=UPI00263404D2|nr:hypothetical protein [Accumulibacter sp.]